MVKGIEVLRQVQGEVLRHVWGQQFFLDGRLIDSWNVVFLQFDYWLRIVTSDGVTTVQRVDAPGQLPESFEADGGSFAYPLVQLSTEHPLAALIGEMPETISELLWQGEYEESVGVVLRMSGGGMLVIYDGGDSMELLASIDRLPVGVVERAIAHSST